MVLVWFNPWEGTNLFKKYVLYLSLKVLLTYLIHLLNIIYYLRQALLLNRLIIQNKYNTKII